MESKKTIDINADLGEFQNASELTNELNILKYISSCSVACGGHIGNTKSITLLLEESKKYGVTVGPHPSYPDKKGFGRRKIDISLKDLENSLRQQIQCFLEIADSLSTPVRHIKLHGALYNETAKQEELADLLIHVVDSLDLKVAIIGPKNSVLEDQVEKTDLLFLSEGFIDRRYREDYSLVDRGQDDALLKTIEEQIAQARGLVVNQKVTTDNNLQIDLKADTLCVHGDNPNALKLVKEVCDMLKKENIKIQSHFS
ncbi:MAG: 5-oxoprolinase subunit PxpA [Pseudomonadota bacterium]|nr:5-oxoprolinase subunit PxpA [Pseudomonadota bacterium]|tara:strand:- start:285 stop:1055 length:771 start_codon:yes stop_codon:yes gene_type:complete